MFVVSFFFFLSEDSEEYQYHCIGRIQTWMVGCKFKIIFYNFYWPTLNLIKSNRINLL